jgi:hypothetical protein
MKDCFVTAATTNDENENDNNNIDALLHEY